MRRHLERGKFALIMATLSALSACGLEIPPQSPTAPRVVTPLPPAPATTAAVRPVAY